MKSQKLTQKIEDTLNSIEGLKKAEVPEGFYEEVLTRLESNTSQQSKIIPLRIVWQVAACIALILSVNFYTVWHFSQNQASNKAELKSLAGEYFCESNPNY